MSSSCTGPWQVWHSTPGAHVPLVPELHVLGHPVDLHPRDRLLLLPVVLQDADALELVVLLPGTGEWQPMHSSTDGTPATRERSVPEWQYRQSISYSPAWCLWLNGMGWCGPGASSSQAASCERQAMSAGRPCRTPAGSRSRGRDPRPCAPSAPAPRTRSSPRAASLGRAAARSRAARPRPRPRPGRERPVASRRSHLIPVRSAPFLDAQSRERARPAPAGVQASFHQSRRGRQER